MHDTERARSGCVVKNNNKVIIKGGNGVAL